MFTFRKSLFCTAALASLALLCAAPARAQKKVELRLNLQEGQTYDQTIAMQQKISQTIQKQRWDSITSTRFVMQQEVMERNSDGTLKIKTIYKTVQADTLFTGSGNKQFVIHYDSTKPSNKVEAATQVFQAMIGQSIISTVSPRGEVVKIEGFDQLAKRIVDSQKIPAAQRAQMLKAMETGMKSQTGQTIGLAPFPEMPIAIGDSWTTQNSQAKVVPILLITNYTLAAIKNGVATLNVQSKISSNPDSSAMEVAGSKVKTDFSGTQSGVMRVDEITGLPQNFELHMRMVGRISINNAKMPEASATIPMHMKLTTRGWTIITPR